jgi:hypothetical protein
LWEVKDLLTQVGSMVVEMVVRVPVVVVVQQISELVVML